MKYKQNKNEQLKIAMIGHKRIPSREGGVEIVVEELATRMVKKGHNITVYNRKGHHVSGREFDYINETPNYKGISVRSVPTIDYKGLSAVSSSFFATIKAVQKRYDCIHYHAEGSCTMLWIPYILGIRTVVTIHGLDWQRSKWGGFASWYIKLGEKIAAKYADEIIVLSQEIKRYFKETYERETKVIPNGVNIPIKRNVNLIEKKYGLHNSQYLLFLGRLVPEKGITYLIDAFKKVKTDKKLVIAGGASDTDMFVRELKNKANDDDRIIFTGFVQDKILEELYSNAYVYILPSDLEGMPLSLLEAMSYENCCLVSDISECTEVVEDKAVIFKKGDIQDLQQNLQVLCDDINKVKQYEKGTADFIFKKYNWDDIVSETIELYRP
nr:glycosyltransferase family 4 protein [uncultured Intestinibacter sp.]